ncbi:chromate efflux transporter [Flavobacterium sp. C4GT6]|uniref:chromate efflux transporter n=1 Tax=Flavobacterium sp. C4GT6 TaxID=3103818 RepID=UPI002ED10117
MEIKSINTQDNRKSLKEIALLFIKLGCTAFGGPAAHIAMMQREVVHRRKWMDEQDFLDLIGAVNLIPGPNSTELALHLGQKRGGAKGLIISGLCFILPAVLITALLAWLYHSYGQLPQVQPFIYGIKPAIVAVILSAIFPLARKSAKSTMLILLGLAVLALSLLGCNEIVLLFGAGLLALVFKMIKRGRDTGLRSLLIWGVIPLSGTNYNTELNYRLFFIFLKIGAILYGSGYVLFAFLESELVAAGMLSRKQLMDAIAVGQFTPGPVFSAVTFVGWQVNGPAGAFAATIAVFLPSFIFVALLGILVKKLRKSPLMTGFLDAVNVASVAIILSVCVTMAAETVTGWRTILICALSLYVTFRYRELNTAYIVIGGAVSGYLLSFL